VTLYLKEKSALSAIYMEGSRAGNWNLKFLLLNVQTNCQVSTGLL